MQTCTEAILTDNGQDFRYHRLNLNEAAGNLAGENNIYLAQHPANSLYYMGSALAFRAAFVRSRIKPMERLMPVTRSEFKGVQGGHPSAHRHRMSEALISRRHLWNRKKGAQVKMFGAEQELVSSISRALSEIFLTRFFN
jgi:hypothetical protein